MNENLTGSPSRRRPSLLQDLALHAEGPVLLAEAPQLLALVARQGSVRAPPRVDIGLPNPVPDRRLGQVEVSSNLGEASPVRLVGLLPDQGHGAEIVGELEVVR